MNRLMAPKPLYKVKEWLAETVLEDAPDVGDEQMHDTRIGRTLDDLYPHLDAICLLLGEPGVEAEMALNVTAIAATQRGLVWTLVASILTVAVVASILGTYLARRIGRPLARLAEAAGAMSEGDLSSPLILEARVREVAQVA